MKKSLISLLIIITSFYSSAQKVDAFELGDGWIKVIESLAPSKPLATPKKARKVLVLSLYTGFKHWVIPHTSAVIQVLADKSQAFEVVDTKEIGYFEDNGLIGFDAVILNNTCSEGTYRNLFWDKLGDDKSLSEKERKEMATKMENNLMNFVKSGGGLVAFHGGIVTQNKTPEFGVMMGGSFDYHPAQQNIEVSIVDDKHPITAHFQGKSFTHFDEPYFFNNAYFDYSFRPLLSMQTDQLTKVREPLPEDKTKYIAWIKKYGDGRVFYVSPSHNAQSMENTNMLQLYLNGIQYALGDLECDDSPLNE